MYQNVSIRGSSVILRQLAPPSSERNRPPFFSFASRIKYTRCPRVPGATATPERPQFSVGSPFPLIWVQVTWEMRSEEHTSELQSRGHLVCRLLLEKKKKKKKKNQCRK